MSSQTTTLENIPSSRVQDLETLVAQLSLNEVMWLIERLVGRLKQLAFNVPDVKPASAQLSPLTLELAQQVYDERPLRPVGLCAQSFRVPDDFDAPLPDEMLDLFEGK